MIRIDDIQEWNVVVDDLGYELLRGSLCWFAYDRRNHTVVGYYDERIKCGFVRT